VSHQAFVEDVPHVFMVVPFASEHAEVQAAIRDAARAVGLVAYRTDEIRRSSSIIDRIMAAVASADLVLADVTGLNANCFYELGYADALKRPVVLIEREGNKTPFDVAGRSILRFRDPDHLRQELPAWLIEAAFVNHAPASDDDLNAGRFGRHAASDGYLLSARLNMNPPYGQDARVWAWVHASIRRIDGHPISKPTNAYLYMDPATFKKKRLRMSIRNGLAVRGFNCYGAFSLGAKIGDTALELDLRHVPGATDLFRLL
jgi:hypothetical protein